MPGNGTPLETPNPVRLPPVLLAIALPIVIACRPPGYGKGDDSEPPLTDAPVADDDATPVTDGPAAATCDKQFRLDGHGTANTVWLTGSFIDWGGDPAHGAIELVLGPDGAWTGSHEFTAGQVQYKYIIDATDWINDPTNPDVVDDGFGGQNSVFTCTP